MYICMCVCRKSIIGVPYWLKYDAGQCAVVNIDIGWKDIRLRRTICILYSEPAGKCAVELLFEHRSVLKYKLN